MAFSFGNYNPASAGIETYQQVLDYVFPKIQQYNQKTRFQNFRRARNFYLLDVERFPDNYTLSVSGKTYNIYKVKIDQENRQLTCSCPDGKGYCSRNNTICKHSYFVLLKVLMLKELGDPESDFFYTNTLSQEQLDIVFEKLDTIVTSRTESPGVTTEYTNPDATRMYQAYKERIQREKEESETGEEGEVCPRVTPYTVQTIDCEDELCMVCYNEKEDKKDLAQCPCCKKQFHNECLKIWFNTGKNTCVHCRNPVWEDYIKQLRDIDSFTNGYLNLSDLTI